ncbi:MAG TPA: hypothetical protein DCM41_03890 [Synergistaceae bacterium]|nr:hypothetical protein [Synergistaceae bacterium]
MFQKFVKLRKNIEKLIEEIDICISRKLVYEASEKLELIKCHLIDLAPLTVNEVQVTASKRLSTDCMRLEKRIGTILSKRESGKKQDGNIAFKCNWNDRHYKAPCSNDTYRYNLSEGRFWCRHPLSKCRTFPNEVTLKDHPCYESIALKEMYFGAGWDLSDDGIKYRHIMHARAGRLALLTTRIPGAMEEERIIVGLFFIDRVIDDPGTETKIFGDKEKALEIDYEHTKILFWDYYRNPDAKDEIRWGMGLYRYVANTSILNLLKDVKNRCILSDRDSVMIGDAVRLYEKMCQTAR